MRLQFVCEPATPYEAQYTNYTEVTRRKLEPVFCFLLKQTIFTWTDWPMLYCAMELSPIDSWIWKHEELEGIRSGDYTYRSLYIANLENLLGWPKLLGGDAIYWRGCLLERSGKQWQARYVALQLELQVFWNLTFYSCNWYHGIQRVALLCMRMSNIITCNSENCARHCEWCVM